MADMKVAEIVQHDLSHHEDCVYVIPIGDMHLGDDACDLSKLNRYLDWVEDEGNAYILLNGDLMNVAIKSSVSDVHEERYSVNEQKRQLVKIFEPYRDKILCMTSGNHEERVRKTTGLDLNEVIADELGIPFCPDEAYIRLHVGERREHGFAQRPIPYDLYMTHGWAGGRRPGATANMLEDCEHIVDADVYITGHSHKEMGYPLDYFTFGTKYVTAKKHLFVSTGGYLRRKGYPVRKGYRPTHIGSPRIRLDGQRKDAHVSI